ncbi:MAG: heme ABC transporter ATP-binding protein [Cyclobacteriaceae bacterium]|nr:heme ABC transporter ATP-binding protein [Cyclobacteriaceae bacterium]
MSLQATNVTYSIRHKQIVRDCSLEVQPGVFTAVVGPNGAGKTSLLKILANEVTNYRGQVQLNGMPVYKLKHRELSKLRAVLPQHTTVNFPFTIEQVIQIGRYAHLTTKNENERIITEVMERTSLTSFKGRMYQTLSGGEQQRVQMARVMAQIWDKAVSPKYLLLDEPTSSLDLSQQHALLELAKNLCSRNIGVLAILHDLNLAAQYGDEVLFLKGGITTAQGTVLDVMTRDVIEETFSHPVKVNYDEDTNRPVIYPLQRVNTVIKNHQTKNHYIYE